MKLKNIQSSNWLNNCAKKEEANCTPGSLGCPRRGDIARSNPSIPYIISPRRTSLFNDQPIILTWNAVSGVDNYYVTIEGEDFIWSQEVTDNNIIYDGEFPLQPGTYYSLFIEASNYRYSSEDKASNLGFTLLTNSEQKEVRNEVEQVLNNTSLNTEGQVLSLAQIYLHYDLKLEAINSLQKFLAQTKVSSAVYRTLAEIYHSIELANLAEKAYLKAVELAASETEQVAATEELASLYIDLGEANKARSYLEKVIVIYESWGDTQRVMELSNLLNAL